MPILERTPPTRRAQVGVEHGPETSSPSRAKFDRNGDKQVNAAPVESEYVFPPLDAMASAMRERSSAMTGAARYTPTMSHGESNGVSGGLRGSASGGSGRRLLGAGGRNAPVLTATAGKSHPPLGAKVGDRDEQTHPAHDPSRSSISRGDAGTTQESSARRPQLPSKDYDHDERPIRSAAVSNDLSAKPTTDSTAFEAQMERALASGANPFQDRKRDQMRGDSTVVASKDSPRPYASPQIESPRPTMSLQTGTEVPLARSPRPSAKANQSQAEKQSTPTKMRLARPHTPDSERRQQKQDMAQIQEDLAARTLQVAKVKAEAEDAKRAMRERETMYKQQSDRFKVLERQLRQLQAVKSSNKGLEDDNLANLMTIATSWEVSRIRFSSDLSKASETRERDIEAVNYRNEVSYMDARRAEAQLDLQEEKLRVKDLRRKEEMLLKKVQLLEESNEEADRRDAEVKIRYKELLAEIEAGTKENASVEKELRLMKSKYEEERKKAVSLSEQLSAVKGQLRNSQRTEEASDELETPIQQQKKQKPKSTSEIFSTRQQKVVESVRQSPRKAAISTAIKSTISSVRGPDASKQVAAAAQRAREEEQGMDTFDDSDSIAPLAAPIIAKEAVGKKATKQKPILPSEEVDEASEDEGDDYKLAKKSVKKSSILSRGKKPAAKEAVKTRGKATSSTFDDDAEMQRQVEQTPMLVSKKRKASVTRVNEEAEEEEEERDDSLDVDATPVVKPRKKIVKKGDKEKPGRHVEEEEDMSLVGTRTPMVPTKRPAVQQPQAQQQHNSNSNKTQDRSAATAAAPTTTAPEVKKKKRRLLKPNTNVANNFFSANGDEEGDLDPKLNLPLQLSPVKGGNGGSDGITKSSSSALLGGGQRGMSAAASRIFRR